MFTIGLAQCAHPVDVREWARRARGAGVDLLVFPEAMMTRFDGSVERFRAQAQSADGPFASAVDAIAADEGLWIAYTMNEAAPDNDSDTPYGATLKPVLRAAASSRACPASEHSAAHAFPPAWDNGGLPFNTAIVTGPDGRQRARYRKVHLFDAQGHRESDRMSAGNTLMQPLATPFAKLGLAICYDLRFPEVVRAAALAGAELMLFPAAWVAGPGKVAQWETLLAARAIENGLFVAGVSSCDEGRIGNSRVYAPDGTLLAAGGDGEELVTCGIDLQRVDATRAATPSLEHRRPECYP